jgi:predicted amidohydrolase
MRVALIQLACDLSQPKQKRVDHGLELVRSQRDADLIVLPEIWATGYFAFDRYESEAEGLDGALCQQLAEAARLTGAYLHAGTIVERDHGRLYNTGVLFSPMGELLYSHRKYHLFGYRSREPELLEPAQAVGAYAAPFASLGLTACYDLRFPELFRLLVDRGAEMFLIPAAWPAARVEHWRLLLRARALENQCLVLACNGCGTQNEVQLGGHSAVVAPDGALVAEAGSEEQILQAEVDPSAVAGIRTEFPSLADRRLYVNDPTAVWDTT